MAELKTKPTEQSVTQFLNGIENEKRRTDAYALLQLMQEVTQMQPRMWGTSMIGFGNHHYHYESGHEGDTFVVGFSPRKQNLVLYLTGGLAQHEALLEQLGKHKQGKGCLYINQLKDVQVEVLKEMIGKTAGSLQ